MTTRLKFRHSTGLLSSASSRALSSTRRFHTPLFNSLSKAPWFDKPLDNRFSWARLGAIGATQHAWKSTLPTIDPDSRRYLNVQLDGTKTEINLKNCQRMSDVQDFIKAEFGLYLPAPASRIYLELPNGERIEDLDDIPDEYFLKPRDPKSRRFEVKWDPNRRSALVAHGVNNSCKSKTMYYSSFHLRKTWYLNIYD
jgi:hypothetical protein